MGKNTDDRLRDMMHALISELAKKAHNNRQSVKNNLKQYLIEKNLIKKSTKELGIKGLALACNKLNEWINIYD